MARIPAADVIPASLHHGGAAVLGAAGTTPPRVCVRVPPAGIRTADTFGKEAAGADGGAESGLGSGLPPEAVEAPATLEEARRGSLRALLERNRGGWTGAAFLIGERSVVSRAGDLFAVGGDYAAIRQRGREAYFVSDLYGLRYAAFSGAHPSGPAE